MSEKKELTASQKRGCTTMLFILLVVGVLFYFWMKSKRDCEAGKEGKCPGSQVSRKIDGHCICVAVPSKE